jgi:hypothetical protein
MKKRDCEDRSNLSQEANSNFQQLELSLAVSKPAVVLCFDNSRAVRKPQLDSREEATKRLLDFAATLPDW